MRDAREKRRLMDGGLMDVVVNLIRGMHVVCVDVGWAAFCGARRLRASRVATVGLEVHEWWGEIESDDGGWNLQSKSRPSASRRRKKYWMMTVCGQKRGQIKLRLLIEGRQRSLLLASRPALFETLRL